jgi:RNA polymerase sigma factor (sigma-70 family)
MSVPYGGAPAADAGDQTDRVLVERALEGSRDALGQLVERHQAFVYNVALKMFGRREDAEDLTQEVFVKVITSLKTFRNESALRTWLYRLTVNHFLKTRRRPLETSIDGFESYFEGIAAAPDDDSFAAHGVTDETVEELRLRCTSGMLMCLDREQRMTFILGAMFSLSHQEGAAALGTTPGNFRVRLHRARRDLYSWMNRRCGLVNQANPCRCRKKTVGYVRLGFVDPQRLVFNTDYAVRIDSLTRREAAATMQAVEDLHEEVFRSHPLQRGGGAVLDAILGDKTIRSFFKLA